MDGIVFNPLGFSKKLVQLGFSQEQAEYLANFTSEMEAAREAKFKADLEKSEANRKAEQEKYEAERRNTLATKSDIEKIRADLCIEIERLRGEVQKDIKSTEIRLLRWQIGIGVAILAVVARGFGWLGF